MVKKKLRAHTGEDNQTKWVGVRPTSPAEDIPVTLNGEVIHVIVDSG